MSVYVYLCEIFVNYQHEQFLMLPYTIPNEAELRGY